MRLEGRVAMITGAASGIGRAMAIEFAAEGASVVIADTSEAGGTEVADAIRENGGAAEFVNTDVTRAKDAEGAVSRAVELYGALHILMNNAGIMVQGSVTEITEGDWDRVLSVNLKGRSCVPSMRFSNSGNKLQVEPSLTPVRSTVTTLREV